MGTLGLCICNLSALVNFCSKNNVHICTGYIHACTHDYKPLDLKLHSSLCAAAHLDSTDGMYIYIYMYVCMYVCRALHTHACTTTNL